MLPLIPLLLLAPSADPAPTLDQQPNTWVKRSPLAGGPKSPELAYECALAWDSKHRRLLRFAGHNQSGGGEQNAEMWAFDPLTAKWELKEPNTSPPGACCNQQNVFDADQGRYIRFPAFSGSHGWHWFRENYLSNSSAWGYDLGTNTWRDRRPLPAPRIGPLRCASWDTDYQVAVVFGGEGGGDGTHVYDPYTNTWHNYTPKVHPAARSGGNMAYDPVAKKHILFGSQFTDDRHTWAFDLRTGEWTDLKPKSQPPTDRNDPVMAYDPNVKKVVALVRIVDKSGKDEPTGGHLETWAYDSAANTWAELTPPAEPQGWHNRRRVLVAAPELNALLMEVYVNPTDKLKTADREQQVWTYRTAAAKPVSGVQPPRGVRVVNVDAGGTQVMWDPSPNANGYVVYSGIGETPWAAEFKPVAKVPTDKTTVTDQSLQVPGGKVAFYRVAAVDKDGKESAASSVVRVQPRVVEDLTLSVISEKEVRLKWPMPPAGVTGLIVERAPVEVFAEGQVQRLRKDTPPLAEPSVGALKKVGKFERITKEPLPAARPEFTDTGIDLSKPTTVEGAAVFTSSFRADQLDAAGKPYRFGVYAYRVRAVNAAGVEGGPSPYVLTIPGAVQQVFSKEDGEKCSLKWATNPEAGVKGYRVYRMEGPKINGPGQPVTRLTPDPITGTAFTDEKATKQTKRYWVVAVDALGQEGIPSAPAWSWRQFRSYYVPFTGEWHQ